MNRLFYFLFLSSGEENLEALSGVYFSNRLLLAGLHIPEPSERMKTQTEDPGLTPLSTPHVTKKMRVEPLELRAPACM